VKVTLDAPLARNMKYSRGTEVFIQWRDPDTRQVFGLSFSASDAADGFQQWLDYATNPPDTAAARSVPAAPQASASASSSGESHYQRPQIRPSAAKQPTSNGPDVIDCHQQSVHVIVIVIVYCIGLPIHCNYQLAHYTGFCRISRSFLNRFQPNLQA